MHTPWKPSLHLPREIGRPAGSNVSQVTQHTCEASTRRSSLTHPCKGAGGRGKERLGVFRRNVSEMKVMRKRMKMLRSEDEGEHAYRDCVSSEDKDECAYRDCISRGCDRDSHERKRMKGRRIERRGEE